MKEIFVEDKQKFLNENYPFGEPPALTDKFRCIHCGEVITVGDYKVFHNEVVDFLEICCPNAPKCDGNVMDWLPVDANL